MYKIQEHPDIRARLESSSIVRPIITLKDEYGGVSHIIKEDGCYVLINGNNKSEFRPTTHWYPEAVDALKTLVTPKYPVGGGDRTRLRKRARGA
jgi:hypothetical protein